MDSKNFENRIPMEFGFRNFDYIITDQEKSGPNSGPRTGPNKNPDQNPDHVPDQIKSRTKNPDHGPDQSGPTVRPSMDMCVIEHAFMFSERFQLNVTRIEDRCFVISALKNEIRLI